MFDASEVVDLCDSEDESTLRHVGELTVVVTDLPVVEELRGSPAEVLPCPARRFINNPSGLQRKRNSVHLGLEDDMVNASPPGNDEWNLRVESVFSVSATNYDLIQGSEKREAHSTNVERIADFVKNTTRIIEDIIEIDDDSDDERLAVEPSDSESCHRTLPLARGSAVVSVTNGQCVTMDLEGYSPTSTGPSESHSRSLDLNVTPSQPISLHYPTSSPELHISTPEPDIPPAVTCLASPESRWIDGEQLVDMPEFRDHNDDATSPPYSTDDDATSHPYLTDDDDVGDGEGDGSDASKSDDDSENREAQFVPPRSLFCIYCDYSTKVEEWYHKHIAGHLPGTKPYFRMYCTDCSYSTGSEKFLLFHMSRTHKIRNPEFYRSGEKRYTCRICKHTLELRIDIESHIKKKHRKPKVIRKQRLSAVEKTKEKPGGTKFKCVGLGWNCLKGCSRYFLSIKQLRLHIYKIHNIKFPWVYEIVTRTNSLFVKYGCFTCDHKTTSLKCMRQHTRTHYTRYQLRAPCYYMCPFLCCYSVRRQSEILEHIQLEHPSSALYYRKQSFKPWNGGDVQNIYACFFCPFVTSSEQQIANHSVDCAKKKIA